MANVTFIIGNGLDLSLGLKTSYRDFYEYVQKHNLHPGNRIYKAIAESPESWADFELTLGQYTDYIDNVPEKEKKKESVRFHEELDELRDDLGDYLDKEQQSIEGANGLRITHDGYFSELSGAQRDNISAITSQGQTVFQFVTLNYTVILEKIIVNSRQEFQTHRIAHPEPLHVHGDLFADLTLGVSDDTQLSASMSGDEKDDLIKPNLIHSMNDGRIVALNQRIYSSAVIVLFGTSIGETDKYIWQAVTQWLAGHAARRVVIHKHDGGYTDGVRRSSRAQKQFNSGVQEKLLRFSGMDGDKIVELKNQILVVHNTKKFLAS